MEKDATLTDFENNGEALQHFVNLDDNDIWSALKVWTSHPDKVLSLLSDGMVNRKLFKIEITRKKQDPSRIEEFIKKYQRKYNLSEHEARYLISHDVIATNMYSQEEESIDILYNDGSIKDIPLYRIC